MPLTLKEAATSVWAATCPVRAGQLFSLERDTVMERTRRAFSMSSPEEQPARVRQGNMAQSRRRSLAAAWQSLIRFLYGMACMEKHLAALLAKRMAGLAVADEAAFLRSVPFCRIQDAVYILKERGRPGIFESVLQGLLQGQAQPHG